MQLCSQPDRLPGRSARDVAQGSNQYSRPREAAALEAALASSSAESATPQPRGRRSSTAHSRSGRARVVPPGVRYLRDAVDDEEARNVRDESAREEPHAVAGLSHIGRASASRGVADDQCTGARPRAPTCRRGGVQEPRRRPWWRRTASPAGRTVRAVRSPRRVEAGHVARARENDAADAAWREASKSVHRGDVRAASRRSKRSSTGIAARWTTASTPSIARRAAWRSARSSAFVSSPSHASPDPARRPAEGAGTVRARRLTASSRSSRRRRSEQRRSRAGASHGTEGDHSTNRRAYSRFPKKATSAPRTPLTTKGTP